MVLGNIQFALTNWHLGFSLDNTFSNTNNKQYSQIVQNLVDEGDNLFIIVVDLFLLLFLLSITL